MELSSLESLDTGQNSCDKDEPTYELIIAPDWRRRMTRLFDAVCKRWKTILLCSILTAMFVIILCSYHVMTDQIHILHESQNSDRQEINQLLNHWNATHHHARSELEMNTDAKLGQLSDDLLRHMNESLKRFHKNATGRSSELFEELSNLTHLMIESHNQTRQHFNDRVDSLDDRLDTVDEAIRNSIKLLNDSIQRVQNETSEVWTSAGIKRYFESHAGYGSANYENDISVERMLSVPKGHVIKIEFESFYTESYRDVLSFYTSRHNGTLLASFSGLYVTNDALPKLCGEDHDIYYCWRTDASGSRHGWRFKYYPVPVCDVQLTSQIIQTTDRHQLDRRHELFAIGGSDGADQILGIDHYNSSDDHWDSVATLPVRRHYHAATVLENQIFICGGETGTGQSCFLFDPVSLTINDGNIANMQCNHHVFSLCALNTHLYAVGGLNSQCVERYDPLTNQWIKLRDFTSDIQAHECAVTGDHLYIAGGIAGYTILNNLYRYDAEQDTWHEMAELKVQRNKFGLAGVRHASRDYLYAMGGWSGSKFEDSTERYDVDANEWTLLVPKLSVPRESLAATSATSDDGSSTIWIAGGSKNVGSYREYYRTVETLSIDQNGTTKLRHVASLTAARDGFSLVSVTV